MDKKTKVYIVIIVALITIIVIKPVMNSGIFAGSKQNSYEISFYKPSVKNLRLLEDMKANKCISDFDYEATDKKAVVYISAAQIQKAKSYIMDRVDDMISGAGDNYEITVNSSMDEFTILADSDMDFSLILDEYRRLDEFCEIYQKCNGQNSWKCRGVIKNRETGAIVTDSTQPGENINYSADKATGISDMEKAIETFNNNLYTKLDYNEAYVENGVFYSPAGGIKLTLPENVNVTYGDDLNEVNELEPGYSLQDLKTRLMSGKALTELRISEDDGTSLTFSANYSDSQYDKEYYDEFVSKITFDQFKSEYPDAKLEKADFLGEKCTPITCKVDDQFQYLIFRYHDGFSYTIWGKYKNADGEQLIKSIISLIERVD